MMKTAKEVDRLSFLRPLGQGGEADYASDLPEVYVPSGLRTLDSKILGAISGELTLIAGDSGDGKTSLAVQWAVDNANNGNMAAILSLEMKERGLRHRIVSGLTGIPIEVLRTKAWTGDDKQRAIEAAHYLNSIPLYVDDRSGIDADEAYKTLTAWKKAGVTLGVVDYVQEMSGDNESRVTQVGEAVRALKAAAKDADMPIIALSSLNRSGATSGGPPRKSWLRDSAELEFVSDTIIMLHYPGAPDDRYDDVRLCEMHILKQRNGPTGVAQARFNKVATRFEEP